jgi:transposase InsO family protein
MPVKLIGENWRASSPLSMSRRGNCYDNAMMESFWSSLKRDLIHRTRFATRAEAQATIFEWIEVFYVPQCARF